LGGKLPPPGRATAVLSPPPTLDISSSAIREKVRMGKCIRGLLPEEVERYLSDNGLYVDHGEERLP
jgi:nicotinic acid mononucleotide adenylyltransferase